MSVMNDCPFGSAPCPKTEDIDERLIRIEAMQSKMMQILYAIVGIVAVEFGVVLI